MENQKLDAVTAKIKKLFALSKSVNAQEAAAAMRKAQALMEQYGVTADTIKAPEIVDENIAAPVHEKPPVYENNLMHYVANTFGCRKAHHTSGYTFIGVGYKVKIAAYAATVLLRKLRAERRKYIASLKRVKSRTQKTARADLFCEGWVEAVYHNLNHLPPVNDSERKAIEHYEATLGWTYDGTLSTPKIKYKRNYNDTEKGYEAGSGVTVQTGVSTQYDAPKMLAAASPL
jgi:hypothetical protein